MLDVLLIRYMHTFELKHNTQLDTLSKQLENIWPVVRRSTFQVLAPHFL